MALTKVTSAVIEAGAILNTHIASGAITSSHLSGINTGAVTEGTNLYYTDTRARASISVTGGNLSYDNSTGVLQLTDTEIRDALSATSSGDGSLTYTAGTGVIAYTGPSASEVQAHLSAGTGVTYSGGQISIGQAVGTSDTVSFGNITTAGYLRGPANFTIDPAAYGDDTGTLIIAGNLQVDGTTTTINSTTLTVDDLNLTLASGAANAAAANGAGITVDGASATLLYQASGDKFVFNKGLDVTGTVTADGLTVDGVTAFNSTATFSDGSEARFGASNNMGLFYSSGTSHIRVNSGIFKLRADDMRFTAQNGTSNKLTLASNGDISFYEDTGTTPKFFWDASAESLGIGTSSPSSFSGDGADLVIGTTSGDNGLSIISGTSGTGNIYFGDVQEIGTGSRKGQIVYDHATDHMRFATAVTERMRISSTGDWMVSNTVANVASNYSTQGGCGWVESDNHFEIATTSNRAALEIGKNQANDGNLLVFRKQSTPVGSIGTVSGDLYIGTGDTTLKFEDGADRIVPRGTDGAQRDGAISLGSAGNRFNDLYLSGTISSGAITSTGIITSADFFKATGQNIKFSAGGTHVLNMDVNRKIYPATNNSTDLGHSGTLAFRTLYLTSGIYHNTSQILDSSRNLTNIGTISSSSIQVNDATVNIYSSGASTVIGSIGNTANDINIYSTSSGHNGLRMHVNGILPTDNTGTIIDADADLGDPSYRFKNLHLSGTINSGAITSTGAVTGTSFSDGYVTWNAAQFNRSGAAIEFQFTPTNANWKVKIGANGDNPTEFNAYTGDADFSGEVSTPSAKLKAIAESNTDTAVDVFVYDTRKDSDGGAWRKRTQHTSWYNETLNTSTRGSRKEFPCVAVIVAENTQLTIYDGDDPSMPMWIVFDTNANDMLGGASGSGGSWLGSVTALNGDIAVGSYSGYAPYLFAVNFVSEKGRMWHYTAGRYCYKGDISSRNDGLGMYVQDSSASIVHLYCRDVAITVLPNAPIDADTGLPVPTIAVSTDGGVSVIKDDGTVVDITSAGGAAYNGVSWVDITANNHLIFEQDTDGRSVFCIPIPSADRTTSVSDGVINDKVIMKYYSNGTHIPYPCYKGSGITLDSIAYGYGDDQALVSADGELTLAKPDFNAPANGKVAYIASDYNTGWMHGDIKLATLSDTDTTDVTATNHVTNGDFTSNITGWNSAYNGVLSHSSGKLKVARGSTALYGALDQITGLTAGKRYLLFATVNTTCPSPSLRLQVSGVGLIDNTANCTTANTDVFLYQYFTATSTTHHLELLEYGSDSTNEFFTADNVGWIDLEEDRSVNNKGLQVFGTVTKTAVATGAELVGYSGFSTSNYLQQPYNADLDFGTGDFSIVGWIKPVASTTVQLILNKRKLDGSGTPIEFGINSDETPYLYTGGGSTPLTGSPLPVGTWLHIVAVRQGGFIGIYVNGKLFNSNTGQNVNNVSLADAHTLIGGYITNGGRTHPWQGSMALLRMSATVPTDEQIAKIYNDEKHLFQENAKATLYGSSDAVTALAYDDDTELLHVGTSAGRSVFQGLNRVDNTTDAVGVAISASNGLVVEE